MSTSNQAEEFRALVEKSITIDASPEIVFDCVLEELGDLRDPQGNSMNMKLEPVVGGKWYRDTGHGTGHLWGHVQVIKPPKLLEIYGPMMISAACISHVTWRVTPEGKTCTVTVKHRLFGEFDPKIPESISGGWQMIAERVKERVAKKSG